MLMKRPQHGACHGRSSWTQRAFVAAGGLSSPRAIAASRNGLRGMAQGVARTPMQPAGRAHGALAAHPREIHTGALSRAR
jgi:hypothetical protein